MEILIYALYAEVKAKEKKSKRRKLESDDESEEEEEEEANVTANDEYVFFMMNRRWPSRNEDDDVDADPEVDEELAVRMENTQISNSGVDSSMDTARNASGSLRESQLNDAGLMDTQEYSQEALINDPARYLHFCFPLFF